MKQPYDEAIGELLIASRQCEVMSLEHLLKAVRLVGHIRTLMHQLQRERGASTLYLGSGGQRYAEVLDRYRVAADAAAATFGEQLQAWLEPSACTHALSRLLGRMALALHGLSGLAGLRREVSARGVSAMAAMHGFNELIRFLLAVVFEAADSATDPAVSRALVALLNFMHGKELAGQERAIGAAGFSSGSFEGELRQALVHRIDAQERAFRIFAEFASDAPCVAWRELQAAGCSFEVERLRRRACTQSPDKPVALLADCWFEASTARIDGMKAVEDLLEMHLNACCAARIEADRADLGQVRDRIAHLAVSELRDAVPYAVFFGAVGRPDAPHGGEGAGDEAAFNLPIVGHSVMDLVQRQASRLQSVEDELQAARLALSERKTIERAKALLIRYRGLSEDQAYRLLRQTAMNQNRRLVEVAEATVAMSDLLGKNPE